MEMAAFILATYDVTPNPLNSRTDQHLNGSFRQIAEVLAARNQLKRGGTYERPAFHSGDATAESSTNRGLVIIKASIFSALQKLLFRYFGL
jgi:hypothetical protein